MELCKTHRRNEDMSVEGRLILIKNELGDISVGVYGRNRIPTEELSLTSITFCEINQGRGRSPNTMQALEDLADAIEKDNTEHPIENT